jgi:hypothetical protein
LPGGALHPSLNPVRTPAMDRLLRDVSPGVRVKKVHAKLEKCNKSNLQAPDSRGFHSSDGDNEKGAKRTLQDNKEAHLRCRER